MQARKKTALTAAEIKTTQAQQQAEILEVKTKEGVSDQQARDLWTERRSGTKSTAESVPYAPDLSGQGVLKKQRAAYQERLGKQYDANMRVAEAVNGTIDESLDSLQASLDAAGLVEGFGTIADLTSAGISFLRGKPGEGMLSLGSAVPFVGPYFAGAKFVGKHGDEVADLAKHGGRKRDLGVPEVTEQLKARGVNVREHLEGVKIKGELEGKSFGQDVTDLDVVTDIGIIQVKTGGGKGATKQAIDTANVVDLPVAVFDTNDLAGTGKTFKPSVRKSLLKNGFEVTNNVDRLIEILKSGGRKK